jgi:SnoaL-like domain
MASRRFLKPGPSWRLDEQTCRHIPEVAADRLAIRELDRATGEAYCIAHHLTLDGEKRRLMVAYLRHLDSFAKIDGAWLFAERLLYVDWLEQRALS